MTVHPGPGRRERNKADKRRRIEQAARELFSASGYSAVTTQEVARLADVGTGTLFRYAHSKGELLCMVANEEFRGVLAGAPDNGDATDDVLELCEPLLAAAERQPENALAYHRETIFGDPGPHRDEALAILDGFRDTLGAVLARESGREADDPAVAAGARTVFDVIYMELVRGGVPSGSGDNRTPSPDPRTELRGHLDRVLRGTIPALGAADEGRSVTPA